MSLLPPALAEALTPLLGELIAATPLSGGDVNRATLVEGPRERLVVKWNADAPTGAFDAEADGLRRLRDTGAVRVPAVIAWDDHADPPWLALEYVPNSFPMDPHHFARRFGKALASLHRDNPAPDGRFGLDRDNFLGSQPQRNTLTARWPDFYRTERLQPQFDRAHGLGLLTPERARLLGRVMHEMDALMGGFTPAAVLTHGDLWSGNFLCTVNDEPVLIDPAVSYAEREVELAYTELFGGFPPGFHAAYHAAFPLDGGYARRRPLHQLYPLLIHLNHFGETYGPALDRACHESLR